MPRAKTKILSKRKSKIPSKSRVKKSNRHFKYTLVILTLNEIDGLKFLWKQIPLHEAGRWVLIIAIQPQPEMPAP